jgi:hypothetical protein
MDDDLEVYIASGLDVPTSIVLADQEPPRRGCGCGTVVLLTGLLLVLWAIL